MAITSIPPAPIRSPMFIGPKVNASGGVDLGALSDPWVTYFQTENAGLNQFLGGNMPGVLGPYSAATNITADLLGTPDTRPDTWGYADFADNNIQFNAPAGYVTRILRVQGNVYAMPKIPVPGTDPAPPANSYCAYLWGLLTTAPGGSTRVVPAADDCMAFYQSALGPTGADHFEFDIVPAGIWEEVPVGTPTMGLLEPDGILVNRMAIFLSTFGGAGVPTHIESEMVLTWRFEVAVP